MNPQANVPDLFHYTSAAGLLGILDVHPSGSANATDKQSVAKPLQFWATNCRFLNDADEFWLGYQMLQAIVRKSGDVLKNGIAEHFKDQNIARDAVASAVDQAMQHVQVYAENFGPEASGSSETELVNVTCFSTDGNDLSQFRAYCPDGGYVIGLQGGAADSLLKLNGDSTTIEQCIYVDRKAIEQSQDSQQNTIAIKDMTERLVRLAIVSAANVASLEAEAQRNNSLEKDSGGITVHAPISGMMSNAMRFSESVIRLPAIIKNSAFQAEKEYRVIEACIRRSVGARAETGFVCPTSIVEFPRDRLKSIRVSPGRHQDRALGALHFLKRDKKVIPEHVEIERSEIPHIP